MKNFKKLHAESKNKSRHNTPLYNLATPHTKEYMCVPTLSHVRPLTLGLSFLREERPLRTKSQEGRKWSQSSEPSDLFLPKGNLLLYLSLY